MFHMFLSHRISRFALVFLILSSLVVLHAGPVQTTQAATFTVCASGCTFTTLAAAIAGAASGDTINVSSGSYIGVGLVVDKNLTIAGAGATSTIVQASDQEGFATDRVFVINPGVTVVIRAMVIRHGNRTAAPAYGGGIYNQGTLTLNNVTVSGNHATGTNAGASGAEGFGGGIFNAGTLTLNNSTVSNNTATGGDTDGSGDIGSGGQGNGGGIYNEGTLTIVNASVNDNLAVGGDARGATGTNPSGWGKGAGIYTTGSGQVTLTDCTMSGNTADGGEHGTGDSRGGGIYNNTNPMRIERCTISGNQAIRGLNYQQGGGITNFTGATITGINCTISGNSAEEGGGIFNFSGPQDPADATLSLNNCTITNNTGTTIGGGLYNLSATMAANTNIQNTILAGNTAGTDADCSNVDGGGGGTVTSGGTNLVQVPGSCTFAASGDITGEEPQLDDLALNGGSTSTHGLLIDSPAIDAGNNATCEDTDQRGVTRPRPDGGTCDIGAYEAQTFLLTVATQGTGVCTVSSSPTGISCSGTGPDCTENFFEIPTVVTDLTVTPDTGSVFSNWSGDCSGTSASVSVLMDQNRSCTAVCNLQAGTPPTATNDTATTNEDTPVAISVLTNDTGTGISVTTVGTPSHGTATINTDGTVTYTPAADYNGSDSFPYTITDGSNQTASATVNITVVPVNDVPTFTPGGNVVVSQGSSCPGTTWASTISPGPADESSQTVTFELIVVGTEGGLSFSTQPSMNSSGVLSCVASSTTAGSATVQVTARDSGGASAPPVTFTITFQNPNVIDLLSFRTIRTSQGVQVQWETGSEQHTWGFHVLRSSTGSRSNASRVTPSLVLGRGSNTTGATYSWMDTTVQGGATYTYWLQEVELDGTIHVYEAPVSIHLVADDHTVFLPIIAR